MSGDCPSANWTLSLVFRDANGSGLPSLVKAMMLSMGNAVFDVTREESIRNDQALAADVKNVQMSHGGITMCRKE